MPTKEIKGTMQHFRAEIPKNGFNRENKTFPVVFATENAVRSYNWEIGWYMEILDMNLGSIRKDRSVRGLPVFDNHYPRNTMVQLGRVKDISFENKEGKGTVYLGARADDALISDIENGIVDGVSVGYNVYKLVLERSVEGELPVYRAMDWEPFEVSFAPIQADIQSSIRSQETDGSHTVIIDNYSQSKTVKMTIAEIRAKASDEQKARLDAIISMTRSANLGDDKVIELYEGDKTIEAIRTEYQEPQKPQQVDVDKIRQEATESGKARIDAILKSTRAAKLDDSEAIEFIQSDKSIEEIRQAVIEKYVAKDPQVNGGNGAGVGKEAIEKKREAAEDAMLNRISPSVFKLQGANEFRGMTLIEIVKEFATERGVSVKGMDKQQVADLVFGTRSISTSDFPLLLENLASKLLRGDYQAAPEYWNMIARETSVQDFKEKALYQVDSVNGMKEIKEGGEIQYTTLVESKQTIKVKKYAEGIKFTREAFINDDMNAFSLIPNKFVLDWNTLRGDIVWALISGNVKLADGKELFHADHANLQNGNLDEAGLIAADLLFMNQTGIDGKRKIRVTPKYLIVSPALKIAAKKLMTAITATKTGDVNVFNGAYEPIVEPRLSGLDWYLAADPAMTEGLYYCYLNGNSGLRSNRVDDFDSDSIKFAVRGEFGAQAIDHRGWLKSKGSVQG